MDACGRVRRPDHPRIPIREGSVRRAVVSFSHHHSIYALPNARNLLLLVSLSPSSSLRNMPSAAHLPAVQELTELRVTDKFTSQSFLHPLCLTRPIDPPHPRLHCRDDHPCSRHRPRLPVDSLESHLVGKQTGVLQAFRMGRHPSGWRQDARPPHHSRLHHPRKVTPPHRDRGLGL